MYEVLDKGDSTEERILEEEALVQFINNNKCKNYFFRRLLVGNPIYKVIIKP